VDRLRIVHYFHSTVITLKERSITMHSSLPVSSDDIIDQIKKPFEKNDPKSFILLDKLLTRAPNSPVSPYSRLIKSFSGITIAGREAQQHWKKILEHKRRLELKLCRTVNIKTAIVDYYDQSGIAVDPVDNDPPHPRQEPSSGQRPHQTLPQTAATIQSKLTAAAVTPTPIPAPGYHQERLKEEMQRARRYKHALSAMMLHVDLSGIKGSTTTDQARDKVFAIIETMIGKAIRNVDIRARHSDNLFLLILPNTNKREAQELATRLLKNISTRLHRIPEITLTVPLKVAVGQCSQGNDTSAEFIKRLENLVTSEMVDKTDTVLLLD
jgi:diguanylate cyclase (GGDEF)-like protein